MSAVTRSQQVLFFALAFLFLAALFVRHTSAPPPYIHEGKIDTFAAQVYWEDRIAVIGPQAARQEYLGVVYALAAPDAHTLAHAFGEAIYEKEGTEGIEYCGEEGTFGCFHELVASAFIHESSSVLKRLADTCTEHQGERICGHGLGHGIVGYFGYSLDNLAKTISACDSFGTLRLPCVDGSIMEYNLRRMAEVKEDVASTVRPLTSSNRFTPCGSLPHAYDLACYFELPIWWFYAMADGSPQGRFEQMGTFCTEVKEHSLACFQGIGFAALLSSNFDPAGAAALCVAAASDTPNRFQCAAGVIGRLEALHKTIPANICEEFHLEDTLHDTCVQEVSPK